MNGVDKAGQELGSEGQPEGQRITKKRLVDSLNCINFHEDPIMVHLEHIRFGNPLFLRAYPQPCSGDVLHCLWAEPCPANIATSYTARNFMIDRGLDLFIVDPQSSEVSEAGITFVLPEECRGLRLRRARRYASEGVQVTLMQDAATFSGTLDDFTALSFRVLVSIQPPQTFEWINEKAPLYVVFSVGSTVVYTGECKIIRQSESRRERALVLEPLYGKPRRDRLIGEGYTLVPRWSVAFDHPLARKRVSLEVEEVSTRWFSVIENYESAVLFPGLVIPRVEIEIAPGFALNCSAQVSSGDVQEGDGQQTMRWSVVVLDMSIEDQGRLFALLQRAQHQKSHVCGKVDLDDLLTFFFDTGFVYPKKYATLHMYKERFRETYKKLYLANPSITRHFIQLDKGAIQAHLSMIRFYENTWLLHHHAATGQNGAGLRVLNQVRDYVTDYRSLYSSHMDYLVCYFRPNNRFPNRVFGGFARTLSTPKHCSIDSFAYLSFHFGDHCNGSKNHDGWRLDVARPEDLAEFSTFYEYVSGGLMIEALNLESDEEASPLNDEYKKIGFKREKSLFSLKKDGQLKAIVLAVVSDTGLNLSNLTNCVHVFVVDGQDLPVEVLYRHLALLSSHYTEEEIPILLYPLSYVENQSIPYEKVYNLWAFDTRYAEKFYHFMDRLLKGKKDNARDGEAVQGVVRPLVHSAVVPLV
ncbi:MAG TPA: hypothetical protein VKF36_20710 [Syntrophorhabdales bacterium]|nr:hypothetical protein [Syntrophorhabdales bacterium]